MPEDPNPPANAPADDAGTTEEKSEGQKRLELEKTLATLRKEIAEAEKKELEAKLPTSATKGLEGKTTLAEKAGYFSEVLAYKTLTDTARGIAGRVESQIGNRTVILVDEHETGQAAPLWELIHLQLERFDRQLTELLEKHRAAKEEPAEERRRALEALAAPLAILPSLLGAAADVASFFRVNRTLTGRAITVENEALLAEMARVLQEKGKRVVLPGLQIGGPGKLLTLLSTVTGKRHEADALRDRLQADEEAWKKIKSEFDLLEAFDKFAATLTAKPSGGGASPLETVATVDWIKTHPDARVLYVKVVSQGGEVETTQGTFTKGKITFLAGTVTVFFLLDDAGVLLASGTVPQRATERFKPASSAW